MTVFRFPSRVSAAVDPRGVSLAVNADMLSLGCQGLYPHPENSWQNYRLQFGELPSQTRRRNYFSRSRAFADFG